MDRLPHFRMGFTPSSGRDIQSEYHLPRERAVEAIKGATRYPRDHATPRSGQRAAHHRRRHALAEPSVPARHPCHPLHLGTRSAAVERALAEIEAVLIPLGARPHWGKLFLARAADFAGGYDRLADFSALVQRFDPDRKFRNRWLERHVLGTD